MRFETLAEGFVTHRTNATGPGAIAVGPRTVVLNSGEIMCSCALATALGANDFAPVLYRSHDGGLTWAEQGPVWPHLEAGWSIFVSISRDAAGRLFLAGSRTPIGAPGESF